MATTSREARRRRIVDRGSDRLALITGRIQALPSSSSSSSITESHHSLEASCPPSISDHPDQPIGAQDDEDKSSSSLLLQHESASEFGEINACDVGTTDQPVLRKFETNTETLRAPPWEIEGRSQSSQGLSTVEESTISPYDTEYQVQPRGHRRKFFTPSQISSAIAATESTRSYCALAAAILVVLSCVGFPFLGSRIIKTLIFSRPLYLVLLTNVSIVLARLILGKQRGLERNEQEANMATLTGGYGLAEQVGKGLESGFLLQRIIGALFMDCSVYAIVVICGLSMAQKFGW